MRALIWCEVTCGKCDGIAPCSRYYQNAESIRRIKEKTKDWHWDEEYGNLCPECYREILETRGEQT